MLPSFCLHYVISCHWLTANYMVRGRDQHLTRIGDHSMLHAHPAGRVHRGGSHMTVSRKFRSVLWPSFSYSTDVKRLKKYTQSYFGCTSGDHRSAVRSTLL